jgi:tetratricopeptide (TPR) repeat protein
LVEVERLLDVDPAHPAYRNLKAAILVRVGDYEQAIDIYRAVLADRPEQPKVWMSLGHALKTVGRVAESILAYRTSIAKLPTLGESYWSLANLKTFRFADGDIAAMRARLAGELSEEDRFHFEFALGKALEDAADFEGSFRHYAEGNRLRRALIDYDPDDLSDQRRRAGRLFTPDFFARRAGGHPASDPIFVVGMPRSGSTLVEQILASHPLIEGTMELPDLPTIARRLAGRKLKGEASRYPEALADLTEEERRALGQEYLDATRIQRKTDRPFFIDKLPNNFAHAGLIHLILPNARIVDVRRHPMGCCFSCFKQHFARGQGFSYDLDEVGRYYRDYVGLMAVFDGALPGRVHRIFYERLIADTEGEVRRLLEHVGVPFDDACLRFHETRRAVRTPSSEQVRQPIFSDGMDQWRSFDPWLDPLRDALGSVLTCYPETPDMARHGPTDTGWRQ